MYTFTKLNRMRVILTAIMLFPSILFVYYLFMNLLAFNNAYILIFVPIVIPYLIACGLDKLKNIYLKIIPAIVLLVLGIWALVSGILVLPI